MPASRPLVAISSCLLGERVRYDGDHKRDDYIVETLSEQVDWKAVCPEVGAGLGIPRPPIRLVGDSARPRALRVDDPDVDVTDALAAFGRGMAGELGGVHGYIFKSRSPSCALRDALLFDARGVATGYAAGIFARLVQELFPELPVIDEVQLRDFDARERFLGRVFDNWRRVRQAERRE